ncbi:MAG: YqgE/AlgH family protein [Gammaproteobacteria bacterium]|nr:YqgE/AlgH family protein [Gammaproteobacteria bacterium]
MTICIALGVALAGKSVATGPPVPAAVTPVSPVTSSGKPGPGMFLVARRTLDDPRFGQSVVYLVAHDEDGTMGVIVNRSSDISLSEALPDIEDAQATMHALNYGGPVGLPVILMLVRGETAIEGMAHVAGDIFISAERRVLDQVIAARKPASEVRFFIGHSGWAAGQLDFELERGSWYVVTADTDAIFSGESESLWPRLIERLEPEGIQVNKQPSSLRLTLTEKFPAFD